MEQTIYAFYNNKGGVGKTTLCQNAACLYAQDNPKKQVLVIDLCPQANISQFLLGGGHAGYQANQQLQLTSTRKNIVGFVDFLLKGNSGFTSIRRSYAVKVHEHNKNVTDNLYLIAGDSFLESLSLALNYAVINPANTKAWSEYMTAIKRLCELEFLEEKYESLTVFIDCNPSFSIYTQMGLVSSDFLIVPMMADYSSLEGIKGILSLLYGEFPSAALKNYAEDFVTFNTQIEKYKLKLPVMYEFVFNNFTSNSGVAAAYEAVKNELTDFCYTSYQNFPHLFAVPENSVTTKRSWAAAFISDTKDFHTSGKVSAGLGIPLHRLPKHASYTMPEGTTIGIPSGNYEQSLAHVRSLVSKLA
ncbi:ParA family protein [Dyella sp. LX-66]|uniref:ParA family protein n=1 Tax=unclassified Dyella TaxID=2634549 RepID=UPI001BE092AF|nr:MULTISPECIES: ParA family protein [unclassified Dyella]MBT2119750.1 ParA family protein [Dyella sp. LX-1]MBT2142177.1 ParA family protein [Dyella sp. LX-66]